MSGEFRKYRQSLMPTTHQRPTAQAFQGALGDVEDSLIDRAKQAVKARFPLLAPPDALTALGVERQMPQGASESAADYAARLVDAWQSWQNAGTAFGMLRAFWATGYTNVVLAQVLSGRQFTLDATGALVYTDPANGIWETEPLTVYSPPRQYFWSKVDVIFPQPFRASWQSGGVPSSTSPEADFIRTLLNLWKPGHATIGRIGILNTGRVLGYPIRTLGAANGNLGGNTITYWSP